MKRTCTAHRSDGQPCKTQPIRGGTVCRVHGGSARQVREAAHRRLLEAVDPAITELLAIMARAQRSSDRLRAIREVLDRSGITAERVQVITLEALDVAIARLGAELGMTVEDAMALGQ